MKSEQDLMEFGRVAQWQDRIGCRNRWRLTYVEMKLLRQLVKRLAVRLPDRSGHLFGNVAGLGADLLVQNRLQDGVANLLKALGMGRFAIQDLNDVETILGL